MMKNDNTRLSLLDLFSPPVINKRGIFSLVCGLTAEEVFVENILENFSGLNKTQRGLYKHCFMYLFLDLHSKPITATGLYSPYSNKESHWPKSLKLMHAKVALLAFGDAIHGKPDYFRLIVSTGNWTKEAVNNSINLIWYCDYDINLNSTDASDKNQQASNLHEALKFWRILLGENKIDGYYALNGEFRDHVDAIINTINETVPVPSNRYKPEFVSNIFEPKNKKIGIFQSGSLGSYVLDRITKTDVRKNFLICGSGFYENVLKNKKPHEPDVLVEITNYLLHRGLLAKQHKKWLVFNACTSGMLGAWLKKARSHEITWSLRVPAHPDSKSVPYSFHAKYILLANLNESRSGTMTSGILYLGSGNLSKQGFAFIPGQEGNIEAGVILDIDYYDDADTLFLQLGIDTLKEFEIQRIPDNSIGEDDEQIDKELQIPPPILFFKIIQNANKLFWEWFDLSYSNISITIAGETIKIEKSQKEYPLSQKTDLSNGVKINGKKNGILYEWIVPVLNLDGSFYASPSRSKSAYEIIDSLFSFPFFNTEDDEENDDLPDDDGDGKITGNSFSSKSNLDYYRNELEKYPLHLATTLIETISEKNQKIEENQMPDWNFHLRRTLLEEVDENVINKLSSLKINFMRVLLDTDGFAPKFKDKEYKKVINEIIHKWGLTGFTAI